ncbi:MULTISPECIES: DUF3102 domain-containing protein [unclassified Xanthobacter]|uniref:DUF3102 domain-containing protein n=1 Tax=unclassified Xanthobacter TaxID=2623496 RepID=UPI001EE0C4AE|nr:MULTISPECIES: DUF3102 domain-containing protein [unclassified Xanthobacter]
MLDTTTTPVTTADPVSAPVLAPPMTLSDAINAAHQHVCEAGRSTLLFAKEAGEHLLKAKEQVRHGEFKAWIEKNCAVSYKQALKYMRIAKLPSQGNFDGGIDAFLEAHSTPRNSGDADTTEHADEPVATAPKAASEPKPAKPSTSVKELKAEITRLTSELHASRDALATAEAFITRLQGTPVVSLDDPPTEELAALRKENAELNVMFDEAAAEGKELRREVADLKRQLRKLTPPKEEPKGYNPAVDY